MGELPGKETRPELLFSHVVRGRNAGCLPAVGAARSDLERGTREEPNYQGKGRALGQRKARSGGGVPLTAQLGR